MLLDKTHLFLFEIIGRNTYINKADAQCNLYRLLQYRLTVSSVGLDTKLVYRRKKERLITFSTFRLRLLNGSFPCNKK